MAYTIYHAVDPFLGARAAYGSSKASTNRQDKIRSLEAAKDFAMQNAALTADANRQANSIAAGAQQAALDRDFQAQRMAMGAGQQVAQFQQGLQAEQAQQAAQQKHAHDTEELRQKNAQENFDYEYTAQQRQRLSKLNEARQTVADMEASGDLDGDQAAYARYTIDMQAAGIQPMPMPKRKPANPRQAMEESLVPLMLPDESGNWTPVNDGRFFLVQPDGSRDIVQPPSKIGEKELDYRNKELDFKREQAALEEKKMRFSMAAELVKATANTDSPVGIDDALARVGKLFGGGDGAGPADGDTEVYNGQRYKAFTTPNGQRAIVVNGRVLVKESDLASVKPGEIQASAGSGHGGSGGFNSEGHALTYVNSKFPSKADRQSVESYRKARDMGLIPEEWTPRDFAIVPQDVIIQMARGQFARGLLRMPGN